MPFLSFRKRKKKFSVCETVLFFFLTNDIITVQLLTRAVAGRSGRGSTWPGDSRPIPASVSFKLKKKKNQQQLSGVKPQRNGAASQSSSTFFIAIFVLFYQPYKALFICILSFFLVFFLKKILLLVNCFFFPVYFCLVL